MANTTGRGRITNANFPSGTGLQVIDSRIERLKGIKAPTMNMIKTGQPRLMEEQDDKFRWKTEDPQPNFLTVRGAHAAGATTLTVDEIDLAQEGQYLYNPTTGEIMRISNLDSSTNTADLERGVNGTSAAAIADNEELKLMPAALLATEAAGDTPWQTGEFRQNYFMQVGWKMGQDYWSSAKPSHMLSHPERVRLEEAKQKFLQDGPIMRQMEVAIWYGSGQAMGTQQRGYINGIKEYINVYTTTSAGALNYNTIFTHINNILKDDGHVVGEDPVRKFRLYGNEYVKAIFDAVARTYSATYKPQSEAIAPNLRVSQFESDFGILEFMVINQLSNGELYGVDFSDIELVPGGFGLGPEGLWTEFRRGPEHLGTLQEEWHYFFRGSLKVGHPRRHFMITGIDMTTGNYANYIGPTS